MRRLLAVSSGFVQRESLTVNRPQWRPNRYYTVPYRMVATFRIGIYMRKRIDHWWPVVPDRCRFSASLVSHWYGGPWGWDFSVPTGHQRWILFISLPARWKDKKRTIARRPHAGRTSILDIIVMLKWRHHVTSQRFQDYLEALFFVFFDYKMRI